MTKKDFTGQVAVVTGGGSGIGRAIACRLADAGAIVTVLGRRQDALDETAHMTSGTVHTVSCDVRDPAAVASVIDDVATAHGGLDLLINNAAGNFVAPGEELSPNGWKDVIDIVLNGTFHCTSAAARHMLDRGGSVLNVIASYAWHGHPGTVHSAAAKAGVLAMTRTLAVEWAARGVRVNALAPGPTETDGAASALWPSETDRQRVLGGVPAGRFTTPEEIADCAAFLLEDRATYITGEVLTVDGGQWLGKAVYGNLGETAPVSP